MIKSERSQVWLEGWCLGRAMASLRETGAGSSSEGRKKAGKGLCLLGQNCWREIDYPSSEIGAGKRREVWGLFLTLWKWKYFLILTNFIAKFTKFNVKTGSVYYVYSLPMESFFSCSPSQSRTSLLIHSTIVGSFMCLLWLMSKPNCGSPD